MDKYHLILVFQHSDSHPLPPGSQYKALEIIMNLASIPLANKLNFHKSIGDMLRTELLKHIITLEKSERRLAQMNATQQRERESAKSLAAQLEDCKKLIRVKGVDPNSSTQALLRKTELEVQELR